MNDTIAGRVQEAVGSLAGDTKAQIEGVARRAASAAEGAYGQVRDRTRDVAEVLRQFCRTTTACRPTGCLCCRMPLGLVAVQARTTVEQTVC